MVVEKESIQIIEDWLSRSRMPLGTMFAGYPALLSMFVR